MTTENQVYNSYFLLEHETNPNFPYGWALGGDRTTKWDWVGSSGGQRVVKIPTLKGQEPELFIENDVMAPAGEGKLWELA